MSFLTRWWPLPAGVIVVIVVQTLAFSNRYEVGGHAAEHRSSASFVFAALVVSGVLLWTIPAARRSPIVLVGLAAWLVAGVFILVGNVHVIDALIDSGQATASTGSFVGSPAIDDAHTLADNAPSAAVAAALVVTLGLYLVRAVSLRLAIVAGVLNVLFPPWILPGLGVVIITIAACIRRERAARQTPPTLIATPLAT